jgi:hypothetical protein
VVIPLAPVPLKPGISQGAGSSTIVQGAYYRTATTVFGQTAERCTLFFFYCRLPLLLRNNVKVKSFGFTKTTGLNVTQNAAQ